MIYNVQYKFNGNKFFKSAESSNYLTLLDTSQSKLTVKGTTKFGYGAHTSVKVALTAGDVPLIYTPVTFSIGGKTDFSENDSFDFDDEIIIIVHTYEDESYEGIDDNS